MKEILFGKLQSGEKFNLTDDVHSGICTKLMLPVVDHISFVSVVEEWQRQKKFDKSLYAITVNLHPFTAIDSKGKFLRVKNDTTVFKVAK